jgi:hypothetical protein
MSVRTEGGDGFTYFAFNDVGTRLPTSQMVCARSLFTAETASSRKCLVLGSPVSGLVHSRSMSPPWSSTSIGGL